MDFHFVTDRLAVGAAIRHAQNLEELRAAGITHVVNTQCEFDDGALCAGTEIELLWNGCEDDLLPKAYDWFHRGVTFTLEALKNPKAKVFFHCQAGVHRSPMMLLAVMRVLGYERREAALMIRHARPVADFPPVYLMSVEDFVSEYCARTQASPKSTRVSS